MKRLTDNVALIFIWVYLVAAIIVGVAAAQLVLLAMVELGIV